MDNLNSIGLVTINSKQLKETNGGLLVLHPKILTTMYKAVSGAYQRGYDNAQNNCECQQ